MRCYVPPDQWQAGEMELAGDEAHHLRSVLRGQPGMPVEVFDGAGRVAECEVASIDRHLARVRVMQQRLMPRPALELTLVLGLPREQKLDLLIQKATELGVSRILPVRADHAVMQVREDREDAKLERWQRIALNAAKQCKSAWLPALAAPDDLAVVLAALPRQDVAILCSLEADARPVREVLSAATLPVRTAVALVGPEGDFSARERAAARNAGARPVSLGHLTLRSETAALYALSVLDYVFGRQDPARPAAV